MAEQKDSSEVGKGSESTSREGSVIPDHSYDGIEELDHALPKWWVNLFYITVLFSIGYFAYYSLAEGPTLLKEYQDYKASEELKGFLEAKNVRIATEDELMSMLKDKERIQSGKAVFQVRCVSCHGNLGEGGIGPNLTDDYWIHGGKMVDIVATISKGVSEKGMPPWGSVIGQDEVHSVAVYVKSLRGTNPPHAKAPQGDLVQE